jgi:hypothetical protein
LSSKPLGRVAVNGAICLFLPLHETFVAKIFDFFCWKFPLASNRSERCHPSQPMKFFAAKSQRLSAARSGGP